MPQCEDRTILCRDSLPDYDDMIRKNLEDSDTLHETSVGSKYMYYCKNSGKEFVIFQTQGTMYLYFVIYI